MKRRLISILGILVLVMMLLPVTIPTPVLADTLTLHPDGTGDLNSIAGQNPGGGAHWEKVDEDPPDDGSTYVYTSATDYELDLYDIEDHGVGSGAINSITVYARCYWSGNKVPDQASIKIVIKSGTGSGAPDTVSEGPEETHSNKNIWEDFSNQWTTNPATGSAWTWEEIDNLQIGVALREAVNGGPADEECTQVYVVVDYIACADTVYYLDGDGDDYGYSGDYICATTPSGDYTALVGGDCDDGDAAVYPGAPEVCDDGKDNDCDGYTDGDDPDCACAGLQVQLSMILDGSGSIGSGDWSTMINGLADAIYDDDLQQLGCVPANSTVELTVIQFAGDIPNGAQVEVGPVILTATNASDVADDIRAISQEGGSTPLACGIYLAADTLAGSLCFDPSLKQAINVVTDGEPNQCCDSLGTTNCTGGDDAFDSAVDARDYAISLLGMDTDPQDEIDAEFIGTSDGSSSWLRDSIVYPQPGYYVSSCITRVPTGDGDVSGTWDTAPRWDDVDETTPNDSDYITGTDGGYALFTFTAFDVPAGATVDSLTVYIRARDTGNGDSNTGARIKVNGSYYNSSSDNNPGQNFTTYSYTWTTNPDTGSAWTVDDINGTGPNPLQQIGVRSDGNPNVRISMVYVEVCYSSFDQGMGWVRVVADADQFADTICEKFAVVVCGPCEYYDPAVGDCVPKVCDPCHECNPDTGECVSTCDECEKCDNDECVPTDCEGDPDASDNDQDGVCVCDDCDDNDPNNYPGNTEDCNDGVDNDCDGLIDCADPDCECCSINVQTNPATGATLYIYDVTTSTYIYNGDATESFNGPLPCGDCFQVWVTKPGWSYTVSSFGGQALPQHDNWCCVGAAIAEGCTTNGQYVIHFSGVECVPEICDNGIDDDCDGLIDCDDPDCPCPVCQICEEGDCVADPEQNGDYCDNPGEWETDPQNPCQEMREVWVCQDGQCVQDYEYQNKPDGTDCGTDYLGPWEYYCVDDEVWMRQWFTDYECQDGVCTMVYDGYINEQFVEDCDDGDPCTIDTCVDGACHHSWICGGGSPVGPVKCYLWVDMLGEIYQIEMKCCPNESVDYHKCLDPDELQFLEIDEDMEIICGDCAGSCTDNPKDCTDCNMCRAFPKVIVMSLAEESPTPPDGTVVVGGVYYDLTGYKDTLRTVECEIGTFFYPAISMLLIFDPDTLAPGASNPRIAWYDAELGVWNPLPYDPDRVAGVGEVTGETNVFASTFAILVDVPEAEPTPAPPPATPEPAHFVVSNLNITPAEVKTEEAVTISVNVTNDGEQEGTYLVELTVNGQTIDNQQVTLGAGQSEGVTFAVSAAEPGEYEVVVSGLSGEFTVLGAINWWLWGSIIAAVILFIAWLIWYRRRRMGAEPAS